MLEFVDSDLYFVQDKYNFINPLLQEGSGSVENVPDPAGKKSTDPTGSGSSSLDVDQQIKTDLLSVLLRLVHLLLDVQGSALVDGLTVHLTNLVHLLTVHLPNFVHLLGLRAGLVDWLTVSVAGLNFA